MHSKVLVKLLEPLLVLHPKVGLANSADAERASREAIQRKCEKLEQMLEVLPLPSPINL